jgi:hypothetical protein
MIAWSEIFGQALKYTSFLDRHASAAQRQRWDAMHDRFSLTAEQTHVLAGFSRRMPVLCLSGAWCGDCVNQCPVFDHFARPEVRSQLEINGGQRVPVVVFLSEDWYEVARYGDRPLSTYRQMAAEALGAACPSGSFAPPAETLATITREWLNEFERAQLVLRLSPRLRGRYGD